MAAFSGLGIGLSTAFGCLLLVFVGEIYYLLWWKKRDNRGVEAKYLSSSYAKEKFFHLVCWKKHTSLQGNNTTATTQDCVRDPEAEPDLELGSSKDLLIKAFGNEESIESELMRLHNLSGPPRFLFTIKEETKEDLESEDGKSIRSGKGSRTRSLSDLLLAVDSPFLTPLASPRFKSPNKNLLNSYHNLGFNPLFESSVEAEINRLRSSPPPKFKFLRDAEEKLFKKLMEDAERRANKYSASAAQDSAAVNDLNLTEEKEGSFLGFIVGKNRESSSQVLPLASSPTDRPLDNNPIVR